MSQPEVQIHYAFSHTWSVEVLARPPLIAPSRQYTYPMAVAGEEDALSRGALSLLVRRAPGEPAFLATCALGFRDPSMPTGVFSTPNPAELCAVAGGYAYLIDTAEPTRCTFVSLKPVTSVLPLPSHNLLLFAGFHAVCAYAAHGEAWTTGRLSAEGVTLGTVTGTHLNGTGWDMFSDRDVPFAIDLATGRHTGGGWKSPGFG